MEQLLQTVLDWVGGHVGLTLVLLFLCCAGESIIVLGALIPTTVVLLAAGAFVAFGKLELWAALAFATAGAVAGDLVNFWIGRRFGERALRSPFAQRYTSAIERSRQIVQRHGAKGLMLGRYVGLVRPFIAAIAGAHGMRLLSFLLIEFLAGFLWAGGFIALGLAFSASLGLAAEVAGRLAVLIVCALVLVWLGFWLTRRSVIAVQGHTEEWLHALLDWSHRHRRLGLLGEALANPDHPETPGLAIVALSLLALGALWLALWWGLGWREYPPALDALVYQTLHDLRTPAATAAAVAIAQLGEWQVYAPVAAATLAALLWKSRDRAAAHWIAAVAFGSAISLALFALPTFSTPLEYYRGQLRAHFSGRELILATVIYGFIPVLLATRRNARARAGFYGTAIALLLLILLSELYLGAQWFSMGLFAVLIGALWVAALGLGYRRHRAQRVAAPHLLPLVALTFGAAAMVHWSTGYAVRLDAAKPWWRLTAMSAQEWVDGGYRKLPSQRMDMAGRPKLRFDLQWAGELPDIEHAAGAHGWRWPRRLSFANMLHWLATEGPVADLPVLPQVHAGRYQATVLRLPIDEARQYLLQLWPSTWRLKDGPRIWVGNLRVQQARTFYRLLRYPVSDRGAQVPVAELLSGLDGFELIQGSGEDGQPVWLLKPKKP
ncbi:MAG: DedA family protein [Gammaproteobacteria bacterium]|nr:DedA family protein [Gammaproteobacteria bacterium]